MKHSKHIRKTVLKTPIIPIALFLLLLLLFFQVYRRSSIQPVLGSIEPAAALPGEEIVLRGEHFGEPSRESEVLIAGIRPVRSDYLSWSDEEIVLRVPDDVGSGRVVVQNSKGSSNGVLFTNKSHIPLILEGPSEPGAPYISSIEPKNGPVGSLVTIRGMNFGFERQDSQVFFRFFSGAENEKREGEDSDDTIACSPIDFDYVSWSDQELKIRVPDGASPGGVFIRNNRGESNSLYYEVSNPVGKKRYPRLKGYQVAYGVELNQVQSVPGGSMEIWLPGIVQSPAQRNIEGIHEPEPLWKDFNGVMRYHLSDFDTWFTYRLEQTYWFDRYSIETDIQERSVPPYDEEKQLYRKYTESNSFFPLEDSLVKNSARRQSRRSASPYGAAQALYRYLLEKMSYLSGSAAQNPAEALASGKGDSYDYAMTYVSLCRAAGIPARPVAGFLVFGDKRSRRHYWTEFYLEKFGWVPVDPTLGDGYAAGSIGQVESPRDYYFGNIDNQHISFSRGIIELHPVDPQARVVRYDRSYSLQTMHEEYSKEISRYRSVWKDMEVIGWW